MNPSAPQQRNKCQWTLKQPWTWKKNFDTFKTQSREANITTCYLCNVCVKLPIICSIDNHSNHSYMLWKCQKNIGSLNIHIIKLSSQIWTPGMRQRVIPRHETNLNITLQLKRIKQHDLQRCFGTKFICYLPVTQKNYYVILIK